MGPDTDRKVAMALMVAVILWAAATLIIPAIVR